MSSLSAVFRQARRRPAAAKDGDAAAAAAKKPPSTPPLASPKRPRQQRRAAVTASPAKRQRRPRAAKDAATARMLALEGDDLPAAAAAGPPARRSLFGGDEKEQAVPERQRPAVATTRPARAVAAREQAPRQTTLPFAAADGGLAKAEAAAAASAVAALEHMAELEPAMLAAFHRVARRHLPVTPARCAALLEALVREGAASESLLRRVRAQLAASSRDPACTDMARLGVRRRCGAPGCGRAGALLRTLCAHCGSAEVRDDAPPTEKQREALRKRRENAAVRAVRYAHALAKKEPAEFEYHAGDVAFLVRNAVPRSVGRVSQAADRLVRAFARQYDRSDSGTLDDYAESDHLMGWVEMQHAKLELGLLDAPGELQDVRRRAARALTQHSLEDVTRFDPATLSDNEVPLSEAGYCRACGRFEALKLGQCPGHPEEGRPSCGEPLMRTLDWETLCEALVWSSVFAELGVPVRAADGECSVGDVLRLMPLLRPYPSRAELGRDSFQLMSYFVTHLVFVVTGWGAARMDCRRALAEEYLFLQTNMSSVVELGDAELVGEYVHSLRLLGADDWCPAVLQGTRFLLKVEKRGLFVGADEPYRKRYHAAYCGLIGLAEWTFDADRPFGWHLFRGMPAAWRAYLDEDLACAGPPPPPAAAGPAPSSPDKEGF